MHAYRMIVSGFSIEDGIRIAYWTHALGIHQVDSSQVAITVLKLKLDPPNLWFGGLNPGS